MIKAASGVVSRNCSGPYLFSDATRVLVAAMAARGVKRLICVTGFGAGDSRDSISVLQWLPFHAVFGRLRGQGIQEQLIKETMLDWTIVRAPACWRRRAPGARRRSTRRGTIVVNIVSLISWILLSA